LLARQTISGNKRHDADKLKSYFKQKVNSKIIQGVTPYLYYYYIGSLFYNKNSVQRELDSATVRLTRYQQQSRIRNGKMERLKRRVKRKEVKLEQGNWMMRVMGEPPVVADSSLIFATADQLVSYYHTKGDFDAKADVKLDTIKRKIWVKYILKEGRPTLIRNFKYSASDSEVLRLLEENKDKSFILQGANYDESVLNDERDRIERMLKNNGYFDFNKLSVTVSADTTLEKYGVNLEMIVNNPTGKDKHTKYVIKRIEIDIDVNKALGLKADSMIYKNVLFCFHKDRFAKGVLYRKLRFNVDEYYSYDKTQLTQRQFLSLDNFKYVSVNYQKDTSRENPGLNAFIVLNASKKYQITDDWGLKVSQGFPGPFVNIVFTSRNAFRGCENVDFGVRAGIEGIASVLDVTKVYTSTEYGANLGINFPELIAPAFLRKKLSDFFLRTRLSTGYSNTIRPEYLRQSIKFNYSYSYQTQPFNRFTFSLWDFSVVNSTIQNDKFKTYLDDLFNQGNPLRNSFNNSIISNISFNFTYSNNNAIENKRSQYFNALIESGGTTANFFRSYVEQLSKQIGISYF
ncbi:MAG: hypothetical protein K2Q22_18220, partial [Cytophagales bacterium]|nr:hypothetical protein [Cytophagales bacterium]